MNTGMIVIYSVMLFFIGMFLQYSFVAKDLKKLKKAKRQAKIDPLTGSGNRYSFNSDLKKEIEKAKASNYKFAVCLFDLDGFKQINDTLGHDAGDILLQKVGEVIKKTLPTTYKLYRIGGDEFAIITEKIEAKKELEDKLKSLKEEVAVPVKISSTMIVIEYSMGIAMYPKDGEDREELIKNSDIAMYASKESGKNGYTFFTKTLKEKQTRKFKVENEILKAFKEDNFEVLFMPRYKNNMTLEGFEAKVIWKTKKETVSQEDFIDYIKSMGYKIKYDRFVLRKVCKAQKMLYDLGYDKIKFSMDFTLKHFKRSDFIDEVIEIIKEEGVAHLAKNLYLEVGIVSDLYNVANYKMLMDKLKENNINIIVNNLEVSCESIMKLKQLPISDIKVDCQYIKQGIIDSEVFGSVVDVIRKLNYKTVVVDIDNKEEYDAVIKSKAEYIQGNYIKKALTKEELQSFLKKYQKNQVFLENLVDKTK